MKGPGRECRHLIIGGTIKGATSSVFDYLNAHPEVCGSSVKETFFFSHHYQGEADSDLQRYRRYFRDAPESRVCCEASPNYLGYQIDVAPRIHGLLPDARLLFVLRNPVDRLYSYYQFARGNLELPDGLDFDRYVDLCERFSRGEVTVEGAGIALKHLRALDIGRYSVYLRRFFDVIPAEQIKIAWFDDLKRDPVSFMVELCAFLEIDPAWYRDYAFARSNVTFSGKRRSLHLLAMGLNRGMESLLRQRPALKRRLVAIYKRINQAREGYDPMADATRARLRAYYAPTNLELRSLVGGREVPPWASSAS